MILVFGSILQVIHINSLENGVKCRTKFSPDYNNSVGGRGALQALSAAKTGAKTALIGRMGDDELAKHILLRLRKHGVITSGVSKAEKTQTGTVVFIESEGRKIIGLGASQKASAEQMPPDIISERNIVMVQTELDAKQNSIVLKTAKEQGAMTILNVSPQINITEEDLQNTDWLIAISRIKDDLPDLTPYKNLNVIFLNPGGGCELKLKGAPATQIPKVQMEGIEWIHPEGSEDTFCGTFAAGLYAKQKMDKVILRALIASAIAASRKGAYDAIPYIDEVNSQLKALSEAKG